MKITGLRVTPVAVPDPPLRNSWGVHAPYALRNIIEMDTDEGITGISEAPGGAHSSTSCRPPARLLLVRILTSLSASGSSCATSRAPLPPSRWPAGTPSAVRSAARLRPAGRQGARVGAVCQLPLLTNTRASTMTGARSTIHRAWCDLARRFRDDLWLHDDQGERRRPAAGRRDRNHEAPAQGIPKGQASPRSQRRLVGRDLNPRLRGAAKAIDMEYMEDPTWGIYGMAAVARHSNIPLSTNMCVTTFDDIGLAAETKAVQVILCDHHFWEGFSGCKRLATVCESLHLGTVNAQQQSPGHQHGRHGASGRLHAVTDLCLRHALSLAERRRDQSRQADLQRRRYATTVWSRPWGRDRSGSPGRPERELQAWRVAQRAMIPLRCRSVTRSTCHCAPAGSSGCRTEFDTRGLHGEPSRGRPLVWAVTQKSRQSQIAGPCCRQMPRGCICSGRRRRLGPRCAGAQRQRQRRRSVPHSWEH